MYAFGTFRSFHSFALLSNCALCQDHLAVENVSVENAFLPRSLGLLHSWDLRDMGGEK